MMGPLGLMFLFGLGVGLCVGQAVSVVLAACR